MAEIYLYGDITSAKFLDEDTSAKNFVDQLKEFDGEDVTVHVNSPGGDVFAGLTIHNALKNYKGTVTAKIDGLAASAASLVVCGADKISMASNALMMIHMPATFLSGFYTADEITKARDALTAIEDSIVDTYQQRINRAQSSLGEKVDIRTMLKSETWFSANDAVKWGLADEIDEAVEATVDGNFLIINSLKVDMKKFDEEKLRRVLEVKNMDVTDIRNQEINRIRTLMKLRGTNPVMDALIDVAIDKGQTVDEIQPFIDAVKNVAKVPEASPADKISALIVDQMNSGAEGVKGSQIPVDKVAAQQQAIIDFANGGAK